MGLMKDTIDEGNAEKIRRLFKDFLYFFMGMEPKDLCNILNPDTLYQLLVDLFATMKVDANDADFRM